MDENDARTVLCRATIERAGTFVFFYRLFIVG